jgi:hypothetical protein
MILNLNNPAHCELITRYFAGEMASPERSIFEHGICMERFRHYKNQYRYRKRLA